MAAKKNQPEPNEPQIEEETKPASLGSDNGAHLNDYVVPDIDDSADDEDAPINVTLEQEAEEAEPLEPEKLSRDAFFTVFKTAFDMPGHLVPDFKPVAIQPNEEQAGRAASDATYSLLEIYYPNALMPQSEVMAHLLVACPFLIGKAMIVRAILQARKMERVQPSKDREKPEREQPREPVEDAIVVPMDPAANWNLDQASE